ncbi:MAG: hypothetical protein HC888_01855 [Candidatus Competibacteraceae bacterium]|nr:hypothetical protein [Candidatus Competibacteraceae bacterium]
MSESSGLASMFMEPEKSLIDIPLYYKIDENKAGVKKIRIFEDEEAKKLMDEGDKSIEVLNTKWKQASWREQNELIEQSRRLNQHTQKVEVEWNKYRDLRIKKMLVSWDLQYGGRPLPIVPDNIDALPDVVVFALVDKYDTAVSMDPQEKEKS